MRKWLAVLLVLAAVGGGVGFWYLNSRNGQRFSFRRAAVERGPFLASIAATGIIQPEEVIDVGAQVVGRIDRFGQDPRSKSAQDLLAVADSWMRGTGAPALLLAGFVPHKVIDYGSPVEEGTILAQLDPSVYETRVARARADLERAKADQSQMEAKLHQAESDWRRAQELAARRAIAPAEVDIARAAHDTARANLQVAKAAIVQAQASLQEAEINLGYTTIRSPVKGVIVDRRVNVGQTVVASLNAPSLFLIAKDLKKLEVWASVNEADIGQVKPGQEARFTVDTYPEEEFLGQVAPDQPRLNANMTQNVVTYTVVVNTDNSHLKLLPYLTANVKFVLSHKSSARLVPNSALRWRPQVEQVVPDARAAYIKSRRQKAADKDADARVAWVAENGLVRPVPVKIGRSNDYQTEIIEGKLHEGDEVVTGEESRGEDNGGNPFTVKMFGGGKKQQ
jgi:HlyD family secretion protein